MTIHRLLVLAGLLAMAACAPNPLAVCEVEANVERDTEENLCLQQPTAPVFGGITEPGDDLSAASVQR